MRLALEYVAAFVDFDGTVCICKSQKKNKPWSPNYYGKVCFYSQNLEVLKDTQETISGGVISPPNKGLDVFTLQLAPKDTVSCLKQVLPFLRVKREQALLVIQLHEMIAATPRVRKHDSKGGGVLHSREVMEERDALYQRMKELNHKDAKAFRTNRVNSVKASSGEVTPSQAAAGEEPMLFDSAEGVTANGVSPNDNPLQEDPARKGRHSLSSVDSKTIQ